jgi:hypothetical protein
VAIKASDVERNHAIELYLSGLSGDEVALRLGRGRRWVYNAIKAAGVARDLKTARRAFFGRGGKSGCKTPRRDIPLADLLRRYAEGESANSLAARYGASHAAISARLKRHSAAYRGIAEAAPLRDKHQAAAVRAKSRVRTIGFGEDMMVQWLRDRGEVPDPQCPCGTYNIDIAIAPVAVEIVLGTSSPFQLPRLLARSKHIRDAGWWLCYVVLSQNHRTLVPAVADQIVAFAQFARANPSAPREHRVIRGCGELAARTGDDFDNLALIPASMSGPYHSSANRRFRG